MAGERTFKVVFNGDTKDLEKATKGLGSHFADIGKIAAGVALGEKLPGAISGATSLIEQGAVTTGKLKAQLGLTTEEAENFGKVAQAVYRDNFGGSVEETTATVATAMQQFQGIGTASLKSITENAFRLSDAFGVDTTESIDAAKTLMDNFGLTSDQAFDLIARGFQKGLNRSGDFLDTIGEYSTQFKNGGATADQFFGLLESGMQGGVLGTDKAADAFKEFRVRIQDGSKTTKDGLRAIGINAEEMAAKMADGSMTAAEAFQLVQAGLRNTRDENTRMQAGVALLGTQFEDLGTQGALALDLTAGSFGRVEGAAASLDAQYVGLGGTIEGMKRQFLGFLTDSLGPLSPALTNAAGQVTQLAAQFGPLVPAIAATVPVIYAKATAWAAAAVAEGTALLPIILITAAIAALVVGIVILVKNWDTVTQKIPALGTAFDNVKATLLAFTTWVTGTLVPGIEKIATAVKDAVGDAVNYVQEHWDEIQETIEPAVKAVKLIVETAFKEIKNEIETVLKVINGIVDVFVGVFTGDWDRAKDGVLEIVNALKDGLVESITNAISLVKGLAPLILDAGQALGSALLDGLRSALSSTAGFAGDVASAVLAAVQNVINNFVIGPINRALEFSIPVPFGPDFPINPPDIPPLHLAKGGIVNRPTIALIGEAGPEAVVPLSGPNMRAAGLAGGGLQVHIHGNVYARDEGEARRSTANIAYGVLAKARARGFA